MPGVPAAALGRAEARAALAQDGYLLARGLLEEAVLGAARAELEAMAHAGAPACRQVWYEGAIREHLRIDGRGDRDIDGSTEAGFASGQEGAIPPLPPDLRARYVRKFMGFVDTQPALRALARHPALMTVVKAVTGEHPELFQDMALVKPAGGREKPWHQDHAYFNVALDTPILGVWIPFGRVTPQNGCMVMQRGGHKAGPQPHFKRRDWQICDSEVGGRDRVAALMDAGDVLFFDGKLPHGTPINRTGEQRWAVQFHYRPGTASLTGDAERLAAFGSEGKDVTC